jgi:hypothetical protein
MAVSIPQVVTEDRASGALVVDGSLRFDDDKSQYLRKAFTSDGNRRTFTWSCWLKVSSFGDWRRIFTCEPGGTHIAGLAFRGDGNTDGIRVQQQDSSNNNQFTTSAVYRDTGWYHLVMAVDTTIASPSSDRVKVYINGELQSGSYTAGAEPPQNSNWYYNSTSNYHEIGNSTTYNTALFDGHMTQCYWIDGQQLGPEEFGYTDPLTNTWRPKKASSSILDSETILVGTPTYPSDFTSTGNKTSDQTGLSFGSWTSGSYTGAATKIFKNSTDTAFTLNIGLVGGTTDRYLWGSNDLTNWTYIANAGSTYYQLSGYKYYATSEGSGSTTLHATADGHNSFYLPMDGNSPIGQDQSGNGNNWTPVNFGGSADITKATGALPILNTGNGGTVARAGVFGSEVSANYTTTSNTAAGSGYEFDQTSGFNPSLSFVRGATYTFDYTDSSSHPLRFSSTDPDSSVTSYTDGTNTSVSNTVKITVPHNAPDTLYYYCTSHNSMNGRISVTTDTKKADPYAWKCVFAAPLVGNDVDVSDKININSTAKATTTSGASADSSDSNFYGESFVFDGSNDYVKTDANTADFSFGSGDFTLECWINTDGGTAKSLFSLWDYQNSQRSWNVYINGSGHLTLITSTNGSGQSDRGNTGETLPSNKWIHIAMTKENNVYRTFVDGVLKASETASETIYDNTNDPIYIGCTNGVTEFYDGHIQDVRIYKGVAKYTSNFIPASTSPDILPDTPSGVGTKTQLTKITDGAVSFDGNGDYLSTTSSSSDFTFGTGDFTIEMFLYNRETGGKGFIQFSDSSGGLKNTSSGVVTIHKDAGQNGVFRAYAKNASTAFSTPVPYKRWCHVALVRESGTIKLFVDGKQDATTISSDTTNYATTYAAIGGYYDTNYLSDCTISNVRVNKGTALYTSEFIPPTRELTNVTNTKLLCCQSNRLPGGYTVSPTPGGLNDGTIWSSLVSAPSGFESPYQAELMFNGDTSGTSDAIPALGDRWTLTHNFGSVSTLRYFTYFPSGNTANGANAFEVNGVTVTPTSKTQGGWTSLPIAGGTLTSFGSKYTGSGDYVFVSAIEVDGTVLLDPIGVFGESKATTFNPFTTDINIVRGQEGAYATFNPIDPRRLTNSPTYTLTNGNLICDMVGGTNYASGSRGFAASTLDLPSGGKWYCEYYMNSLGNDDIALGIASDIVLGYYIAAGNPKPGAYMLRSSGIVYSPTFQLTSDSSRAYVTGDLVGVSVDLESTTKRITFYKNGIAVYNTTVDETQGPFKFVIGCDPGGSTAYKTTVNFGQKPFKFPPPDGFQPLTASTVRPDTVVPRPNQYVSVMTYSGTNNSGNINVTSTDTNFTPDFVWVKTRTGGSEHNAAYDSVRGANKRILPSSTNQEVTTTANDLNAFIPGGFTMNGQNGHIYNNGYTHVAWMWKAGGSSNTFNIDDVGYANASDVNMSVGSLNSATIDQSQVWSNDISGTPYNSSFPVTQAFDGNVNTDTMATDGNTLTWTPSTPITGSVIRFRLVTEGTAASFTINGIAQYPSFRTSSPVEGWHTFSGTTVTEVTWQRLSGTSQIRLSAVEVDGKILVDQGVTPQNVPSIPATGCSVGTKQGFSIIKYTGNASAQATLPHGLEQIPDFVMCKNLGTSYNWFMWHNEFGNGANAAIYFTDAAKTTNFGTLPFASLSNKVITFNNNDGVNGSSNYIMYAWHNVPGLQKFGSYTQNDNGVFVELGFKPALLVIKNADTALTNSQWNVVDTQRDTYNPSLNNLAWNRNNTEPAVSASTYGVDILSNGFAIPSGNTGEAINGATPGGDTYIYAAWAEAPAFNLYGAQSNAR